jgi:molybdopterin-containing oxidoreductase family membrane subunit
VSGDNRLSHAGEPALVEALSRNIDVTTWKWYAAVLAFGSLFLASLGVAVYMMLTGIGVTGLQRPVFWGVMIILFVFWIGLSHSGTLISAILRVIGATWRAPVLRGAEAMTAFALMVGGLFPLLHLGRNWRFYYLIPYPSERGLWPNFRSPLLWDAVAINTYLLGSLAFLYVGMIPDLAIARDRSTGWRKRVYTVLAAGFRGEHEEWRRYRVTSTLLALLIIPVAVSVHSIVSWDFAMAKVPGWHSTIFAPYFVVGAIYSGIAGVIAVMAVLRRVFRLERVLTVTHFDNLARLLLTMSLLWGYFYFSEFLTIWYGRDPAEWSVLSSYGKHYLPLFLTMVGCNFVVPFPLLCLRGVRRSVPALFAISLVVNVGMWAERALIIVPSLARRNDPFIWHNYFPTWVEFSYIVGSLSLFCLLYVLFAKLFPIVAISDVKEQLFLTSERTVGRAALPAFAHGGHEGAEARAADRPGAGTVVLGRFDGVEAAAAGSAALRALPLSPDRITTLSSVPLPSGAVSEDRGTLRFPWGVLAGWLLGAAAGAALSVLTYLDYPLITGGKTIVSVPPTLIVTYELAMLGALLATVAGGFFSMRLLPFRRSRRVSDPAIHDGRIVLCAAVSPGEQAVRAAALLEGAGAADVRTEEGML